MTDDKKLCIILKDSCIIRGSFLVYFLLFRKVESQILSNSFLWEWERTFYEFYARRIAKSLVKDNGYFYFYFYFYYLGKTDRATTK